MGVDQGFDIIPRLRDNPEDNAIWARFLEDVLKDYCLDSRLLNDPSRPFIMFDIGEGPRLERDAWRFRRFSSKIVGKDMGDYLDSVTRIAQRHFGGRVYAWSESFDYARPYYDWREIYALREGKEEELSGTYIDRDDELVHDSECVFNKEWQIKPIQPFTTFWNAIITRRLSNYLYA